MLDEDLTKRIINIHSGPCAGGCRVEWRYNIRPHRNYGPAIILYNENEQIIEEKWCQYGLVSRQDEPASIIYDENGNIRSERWLVSGLLHRIDGPADIFHNSSGTTTREIWCENDTVHRDNGPAMVFYFPNGEIDREVWYNDGLIHREDGPARISYNKYNKMVYVSYVLNNVEVPKWLVMTSAEDLDPNSFFEMANVEQSREFVKKIGVERIIGIIGKVVETDGDYQLVTLAISHDGQGSLYRPYLKMVNPSTNDIHIEGVHPECNTVQQALNWRNGRSDQPAIIT